MAKKPEGPGPCKCHGVEKYALRDKRYTGGVHHRCRVKEVERMRAYRAQLKGVAYSRSVLLTRRRKARQRQRKRHLTEEG